MNLRNVASVALAVMLVATAFAGVGAIGAAAQSDEAGADESNEETRDEVRIVDKDIEISDGLLTISDTTLKGPGLGEKHIEDRKYTIDSELRFDGFHVDYDGTRYTFCRITVTVEDVGIHLQDVTLTEGGE